MLLYIHVPFCRRKCGYCAFYSLPLPHGADGNRLIKDYLSSLSGELRLWAASQAPVTPVETIFFGGGTPSLLPAAALGAIIAEIRNTFAVADDAEVTAEANPESALKNDWLFGVRKAGVNRLSLGVQSFAEEDLSRLGRRRGDGKAEAAVLMARKAGFTNVSLDLLWGLPGGLGKPAQSRVEWLEQLRRATALRPEHISAYGLTPEPETPLGEDWERGECFPAPEGELAAMYLAGAEYLEGQGFAQYEISNFARPGSACRHNLGYWEGEEYIGLGPAATSTLGNRRWTNAPDVRLWQEAVRQGVLAANGEYLDTATCCKEKLMLRLRTNKGIDLEQWREMTGRRFLHDHGELADMLEKSGLALSRDGWFRLTRPGMLVSDAILARFFAALDSAGKNACRHDGQRH